MWGCAPARPGFSKITPVIYVCMLFAHPEILLMHPDPETERREFICSYKEESKLEYIKKGLMCNDMKTRTTSA